MPKELLKTMHLGRKVLKSSSKYKLCELILNYVRVMNDELIVAD